MACDRGGDPIRSTWPARQPRPRVATSRLRPRSRGTSGLPPPPSPPPDPENPADTHSSDEAAIFSGFAAVLS